MGNHWSSTAKILEVDGIVQYSEEENLWVAVIDWDAIREVTPVVSQTAPSVRDIAI